MELNVGDVYWLTVTYPKTSEVETRPVVICDFDGSAPIVASFAAITGVEIKDFEGKYDKWKSPIFKWRDAGLDKESYVKANNIAVVDAAVFNKKDYIGQLVDFDLRNALIKINEFLDSGEEPW